MRVPLLSRTALRVLLCWAVVASSAGERSRRQTIVSQTGSLLAGAENRPPHFSDRSYTAQVYENAAEGAMVLAVMAQDADTDHIRYYISKLDKEEYDMFNINPQTGVIRLVSRSFTFDKDDYFFTVVAADTQNQTDEASVSVHIIDVNNHRPEFGDCSSYQPQVEENKPAGTHVLTVHATDADKGDNAVLDYSLVTSPSLPDSFFNIDKLTGDLTTSRKFNRDAPDHEKELRVIVKASDRGQPSLEGTCAFTVTVLDVNDNSPLFDRTIYEEGVARDAAVGDKVGRVSASDDDIDRNGAIVYSLVAESPSQGGFFEVDPSNGIIAVAKIVQEFATNTEFRLVAVAEDQGDEPRSSQVPVIITVQDSKTRPPSFTLLPNATYYLPENYRDTETPVARIRAVSNLPESPKVYYDLEHGSQEQTNKFRTFVIDSDDDGGATIRYGGSRQLDYEQVTAYNLTVIATTDQNTRAETTFEVRLQDKNDEVPIFYDSDKVVIPESSPANTFVLVAEAVDLDRTSPNNEVSYRLDRDSPEFRLFSIESGTGRLSTRVVFDREDKKHPSPFYTVTVIAEDGAPSDIRKTGAPNQAKQRFNVEIGDVNDNPPQFNPSNTYTASIQENADVGSKVIDVVASDVDDDSKIRYQITEGNRDAAFAIDPDTGVISVKNEIDYEKVKEYVVTVTASDGKYEATRDVTIHIINVNDEPPVFDQKEYKLRLREGYNSSTPIVTVTARDPDPVGEPTIVYKLSGPGIYPDYPEDNVFIIRDNGQIVVRKALDRDEGTGGHAVWDLSVLAWDSSGSGSTAPFTLTLDDINDNAPYLIQKSGVIMENVKEFQTIVLPVEADDFDDHTRNGPPYTFRLDPNASPDMKRKFEVRTVAQANKTDNSAEIRPRVEFDREQQKQYAVPVVVSDNSGAEPRSMTGTSLFTVIIGDVNDNDMKYGSSAIQVFNFEGKMPDAVIGRVFVEDPDDWDLPDKTFSWHAGGKHEHFDLDPDTGNITMKYGTPNGTYALKFSVYDKHFNSRVSADVSVEVRLLPREAVEQSGSIRIKGITAEQFISPPSKNGASLYARLVPELARLLGTSAADVDLFGVQNNDADGVDIRYAAHGSPYYPSQMMDGIVAQNKKQLEETLKIEIEQIGIDPCIFESTCHGSCLSELEIYDDQVSTIRTNRTSVTGVLTEVVYTCGACEEPGPRHSCLNGGTLTKDQPPRCKCPAGFSGPNCEGLTIHFAGAGYAWFPALTACNASHLGFDISTGAEEGLVLYNGPIAQPANDVQDFIAVDVHEGRLRLFLNYGSGTAVASPQDRVDDGRRHHVDVDWNPQGVAIRVDSCTGLASCQTSAAAPSAGGLANSYLNVAAPLQLGGTAVPLGQVASHMAWVDVPGSLGFSGCIQNVTFLERVFDLSNPAYGEEYKDHCDENITPAPVIYASSGFLAVIVCIAVLVLGVLLAVFVVRRRIARKKPAYSRQNSELGQSIVHHMEDGGDETDNEKYDLNKLQVAAAPGEDTSTMVDSVRPRVVADGASGNHPPVVVDDDDTTWPTDDLRNYAYEGSEGSAGSLSSINSGSTDGDIDFDYLRDQGPSFRRLADLYGDPADEDDVRLTSEQGGESWC